MDTCKHNREQWIFLHIKVTVTLGKDMDMLGERWTRLDAVSIPIPFHSEKRGKRRAVQKDWPVVRGRGAEAGEQRL